MQNKPCNQEQASPSAVYICVGVMGKVHVLCVSTSRECVPKCMQNVFETVMYFFLLLRSPQPDRCVCVRFF